MSTRATIKIIAQEPNTEYTMRTSMWLYHHCDGYPSGVGSDLKKYLANLSKRSKTWEMRTIVNELVDGDIINDNGYELTNCQHGDEEYAYLISCKEKTIKCYKVGWDDFEWTDDKLVEIPD